MDQPILTRLDKLLEAHQLNDPDEIDVITTIAGGRFIDVGVAVTVDSPTDRDAWLAHLAPDGDVAHFTARIGALGCHAWVFTTPGGWLIQMRSPLTVVGDLDALRTVTGQEAA